MRFAGLVLAACMLAACSRPPAPVTVPTTPVVELPAPTPQHRAAHVPHAHAAADARKAAIADALAHLGQAAGDFDRLLNRRPSRPPHLHLKKGVPAK